jgi:hypothetical protein
VAEAGAEHKPAGRALKCRACNGKLLLNALALQQHVASKQHLRKVKGAQMCSCADGCRWSAHAHRCAHRRGGRSILCSPDTGALLCRLRRDANRPHLLCRSAGKQRGELPVHLQMEKDTSELEITGRHGIYCWRTLDDSHSGLQNVETHHERMQRLQQARQHSDELKAQQPQKLSKGSGAAKRRRRQQRLEAGGTPGGKGHKKQGKPGKRQRSALRQGKQTAAAAPGGSSANKHRAAKKHKPSAPVAVL